MFMPNVIKTFDSGMKELSGRKITITDRNEFEKLFHSAPMNCLVNVINNKRQFHICDYKKLLKQKCLKESLPMYGRLQCIESVIQPRLRLGVPCAAPKSMKTIYSEN